ncbi:HNH endonuclease signature motif containing protein [Streptomyces ossamyceticus]|uniref:HNH endonuclease signature motif containing protein n=1 Tax=Streptomyces ossamyceticus TaxID=249581 RepID=UPI0036E7F0B1
MTVPNPTPTPEVGDHRLPTRFWTKVKVDEVGCWLWIAALNRNGYGRFMDSNKITRAAHRVAYEALIAAIPEGLQLDHLCRVRHCVNPMHTEPVTQTENLRRGETITAKAAAAMRCPKDHPYSGDNLYVNPKGHRSCRQCTRDRNARRRVEQSETIRQQNREANRRYRARMKAQTK